MGSVHAAHEVRTIIVHAGTLLATPGEAPAQRQSIVISDGKILEIRDGYITADDIAAVDSAETIDLSDKFVLPGLMDMHVHFTLTSPRL